MFERVMRRLAPYLFAAVMVSLVAMVPCSGAVTASKAPARCAPRHSRLLAADARAEVWEAPEVRGYDSLGVYGCVYSKRRVSYLGPMPFGSSSGAGGVFGATLAGPIVAYERAAIGETRKSRLVVVRDLRNGRTLRKLPTGSPPTPVPYEIGLGPVSSVVVKADGAVAWIVQTAEELGGVQVHAADRLGNRVLAVGADIAPGSLALAGSTLYWTEGGKPASAALN